LTVAWSFVINSVASTAHESCVSHLVARRHISFKWLPIWIWPSCQAQLMNNLASAWSSYATKISSCVKCG
jgi:hypothetical protein